MIVAVNRSVELPRPKVLFRCGTFAYRCVGQATSFRSGLPLFTELPRREILGNSPTAVGHKNTLRSLLVFRTHGNNYSTGNPVGVVGQEVLYAAGFGGTAGTLCYLLREHHA